MVAIELFTEAMFDEPRTALRTFDPVGTFAPLDNWWGEDSYWRIIDLCKIQCARFRRRDFVLLRPGWRDSRGVGKEMP